MTSPSPVATSSPRNAAIQTFVPWFQSCANETAETVIVDAIEMSISPAITTNVSPNAISPM